MNQMHCRWSKLLSRYWTPRTDTFYYTYAYVYVRRMSFGISYVIGYYTCNTLNPDGFNTQYKTIRHMHHGVFDYSNMHIEIEDKTQLITCIGVSRSLLLNTEWIHTFIPDWICWLCAMHSWLCTRSMEHACLVILTIHAFPQRTNQQLLYCALRTRYLCILAVRSTYVHMYVRCIRIFEWHAYA